MSEASVVWHAIEAPRKAATNRRRSGFLIAVGLVCAMTVAEGLFLRHLAGPDSVNMVTAAEGITPPA